MQKYIQSTDLAKKVSDWHELIRPRLETVEKRAQFDIHKYGSDILRGFPEDELKSGDEASKRQKQSQKGLEPQNPDGKIMAFAELARGKDKEEVCR